MTHFRDVCRTRRPYKVIDHALQVLSTQYCVGENLCSADAYGWLQEVFSGEVPTTVANMAAGVGC